MLRLKAEIDKVIEDTLKLRECRLPTDQFSIYKAISTMAVTPPG